MKAWQVQKAKEIDATINACKTELATNFDCPSEQILGFYGAKLRITGPEMLQAIYRYNQREQGSTLTPVVAVITLVTMAVALIAQSGLLHSLLARLAEVR